LKPHIDATYRTLADAENTGALGSSMGGLVSTYLGWEFPGVFRKIGAFSTAFWRCDVTKNKLDDPPKRPIRIYLDSGDTGDFTNDGLALTVEARDNLIRNGYVFNSDLDHVIGYGHNHNEYWWDRRSPRAFTFLFPTSDEPNTVLDAAAPPRITDYRLAGTSNVVTWTSYRLRSYVLEGSTNFEFAAGMTWSNLLTTPPEPRRWGYPTGSAADTFRFLRVRELDVPDWPD
jgi:pimeloyl-ACP methyl ester carboxylesterase